MPTLREKLEARAKRIEIATAKTTEAYVNKIDSKLYKGMNRFFSVKLEGVQGAIRIKQLPRSLNEEGLEDEITKVSEIYSQRLSNVKEDFAVFSTEGLDKATRVFIQERVSLNVFAIQNEINSFIAQTQRTALSKIMANEDFNFDEFAKIKQSPFLSNLTGEVLTEGDALERAVGLRLGESLGIEHFYYAGTLIRTSRTFCIQRAGRVFSKKEIDTWDNGQGLVPASVYLGGYNCRHRLSPVNEDQAKSINKVTNYKPKE